jgi:tRNA (guanine37-N1)-methyltransferase
MTLHIDVVTLFPELFESFAKVSFVGRARESGALALELQNLRDFGLGKHKSVDDTPYGGGSGMVMRVDVVVACLDALDEKNGEAAHRVLLTPQGAPYAQKKAVELAAKKRIALVCGRYEGFDERVRACVHEEISLGDFVMTGGEVCAMAIVESVARLLPGVLGNAESLSEESHGGEGLLEYPHYTRPVEFRGITVPEVLREGNHEKIAQWRSAERETRTRERRPDLYERVQRARAAVSPPPAGSSDRKKTS